jgi:hypothetical protein
MQIAYPMKICDAEEPIEDVIVVDLQHFKPMTVMALSAGSCQEGYEASSVEMEDEWTSVGQSRRGVGD